MFLTLKVVLYSNCLLFICNRGIIQCIGFLEKYLFLCLLNIVKLTFSHFLIFCATIPVGKNFLIQNIIIQCNNFTENVIATDLILKVLYHYYFTCFWYLKQLLYKISSYNYKTIIIICISLLIIGIIIIPFVSTFITQSHTYTHTHLHENKKCKLTKACMLPLHRI